jgi:hypothetical protein
MPYGYDTHARARETVFKLERDRSIQRLALGFSRPFRSREIADALGLSTTTVSSALGVMHWPRRFDPAKGGNVSIWLPDPMSGTTTEPGQDAVPEKGPKKL